MEDTRLRAHPPHAVGAARLLSALKLDGPLLVGLALLAAYGLVVLYSASGQSVDTVRAHGDAPRARHRRHAGCWRRSIPTSCAARRPGCTCSACVLLLVVAAIGDIGKGAQRWLDLGLFRFQPSEIMKLAVPMLCAWYLHERPLPPDWKSLLVLARDHLPAGGAGRDAAGPRHRGADRRQRRAAGAHGRTAVRIVLALLAARRRWRRRGSAGTSCTTTSASACSPSSIRRPIRSAPATTSSSRRSRIGSGGVFGKGWMNGSQAQLEFLPERSTDFIFAVVGEEFGLIGLLRAAGCCTLFIVARAV